MIYVKPLLLETHTYTACLYWQALRTEGWLPAADMAVDTILNALEPFLLPPQRRGEDSLFFEHRCVFRCLSRDMCRDPSVSLAVRSRDMCPAPPLTHGERMYMSP